MPRRSEIRSVRVKQRAQRKVAHDLPTDLGEPVGPSLEGWGWELIGGVVDLPAFEQDNVVTSSRTLDPNQAGFLNGWSFKP